MNNSKIESNQLITSAAHKLTRAKAITPRHKYAAELLIAKPSFFGKPGLATGTNA